MNINFVLAVGAGLCALAAAFCIYKGSTTKPTRVWDHRTALFAAVGAILGLFAYLA
jgi:hypothetical protein